jgi:hypothetical protein
VNTDVTLLAAAPDESSAESLPDYLERLTQDLLNHTVQSFFQAGYLGFDSGRLPKLGEVNPNGCYGVVRDDSRVGS